MLDERVILRMSLDRIEDVSIHRECLRTLSRIVGPERMAKMITIPADKAKLLYGDDAEYNAALAENVEKIRTLLNTQA